MFNLDQFLKDKFYEQSLIDKIKLLNVNDLNSIENLIENLQPNANIFRHIFKLLEEISASQAKSISEVINSIEIKEANRKEKQIQLRSKLEKLRFPMRFLIQEKLEACVDKISKDYGVNVILPEELEGETVEIKFKVRGIRDLQYKHEKMKALLESKLCEQIFNILEGKDL